jgi:hypothetical protein
VPLSLAAHVRPLRCQADHDDSVLSLIVEDWDLALSNDLIGHITVPLSSIARAQPTPRFQRAWFDVQPKQKESKKRTGERLGRVEVALYWAENAELHPEFFQDLASTPDCPPNELHVAVCRARGLLAMDAKLFGRGEGTSDPLVRPAASRCRCCGPFSFFSFFFLISRGRTTGEDHVRPGIRTDFREDENFAP